MVVYVVTHNNMEIEYAVEQDAQAYATANSLSSPISRNKIVPDLIESNLTNGLTQEQSDTMLDMYVDVLLELKADDLVGAITLLEAKTPEDFITQDIINNWIGIIEAHE